MKLVRRGVKSRMVGFLEGNSQTHLVVQLTVLLLCFLFEFVYDCSFPQSFAWRDALPLIDSYEAARADAGLSHACHTPRAKPEGSWPPGTKPYFGAPANSSEFCQCYLPGGFSHQGRKSKSLSFNTPGQGMSRSTSRSKECAVLGVQSWAWAWYNSLSADQQNTIKDADLARPSKRIKTEP